MIGEKVGPPTKIKESKDEPFKLLRSKSFLEISTAFWKTGVKTFSKSACVIVKSISISSPLSSAPEPSSLYKLNSLLNESSFFSSSAKDFKASLYFDFLLSSSKISSIENFFWICGIIISSTIAKSKFLPPK